MVAGTNLVQTGLVSSLACAGENIPGISNFQQELSQRRLELLKEIVPKEVRFQILHTDQYDFEQL